MSEEEGRKSEGDTWWRNGEVKQAVSRKDEMHTRPRYRIILRRIKGGIKANNAVSKSMREKTEDELTELKKCLNKHGKRRKNSNGKQNHICCLVIDSVFSLQ